MATAPSEYLREDVWYIAVGCIDHGTIDEAVPWENAKTPLTARRIADQRHSDCGRSSREAAEQAFAAGQIDAAEKMLGEFEARLAHAVQADDAELVTRERWNVKEQRQRAADARAANRASTQAVGG